MVLPEKIFLPEEILESGLAGSRTGYRSDRFVRRPDDIARREEGGNLFLLQPQPSFGFRQPVNAAGGLTHRQLSAQ
jgi:hypothetical protein